MPRTQLWRYSCDLCKEAADTPTEDNPPDDWIEYEQRDPYPNQPNFRRIAVCPKCLAEIERAVEKRDNPPVRTLKP